mmetsp:Transcript_74354/g.229750  ORF Transcript_74354/g.229750 Transcript_74354/m.229750 type:complete len:301 (-) Transcript_74354:715-1617(-)
MQEDDEVGTPHPVRQGLPQLREKRDPEAAHAVQQAEAGRGELLYLREVEAEVAHGHSVGEERQDEEGVDGHGHDEAPALRAADGLVQPGLVQSRPIRRPHLHLPDLVHARPPRELRAHGLDPEDGQGDEGQERPAGEQHGVERGPGPAVLRGVHDDHAELHQHAQGLRQRGEGLVVHPRPGAPRARDVVGQDGVYERGDALLVEGEEHDPSVDGNYVPREHRVDHEASGREAQGHVALDQSIAVHVVACPADGKHEQHGNHSLHAVHTTHKQVRGRLAVLHGPHPDIGRDVHVLFKRFVQ